VSELQLVVHNDGDDNLLDLEVESILPADRMPPPTPTTSDQTSGCPGAHAPCQSW
jgi:hypothetical protein